ncbi:YqaJ-like viral recombinase domain protein [compost metagenome]
MFEGEVLGLEQQTVHWLEWRKSRIGSSDACIIMQSVDWSTPRELYLDKTGQQPRKKKRTSTHVMDLGNEFEPKARAIYELTSGKDFRPTILVSRDHPWRIASLDGYNNEDPDFRIILEIKCVQGDTYDIVKRGELPPKYKPQVQHQLDVAQAQECHFFVAKLKRDKYGRYFIEDTALVIVKPDKEYQKELLLKETDFHECVKTKTPPPLTERDFMYCDDQSTVLLFAKLKEAKINVDRLQKLEDAVAEKMANLQQQKADATACFDEVKTEAIKYVEKELKHNKISAIGVNMVKNKNGVWAVRLEAPEPILQGTTLPE